MKKRMKHALQNIYILGKICLTLVKKIEIAITKMSSKGQIVIPANMRKNIREGEQLIIIQSDKQFVLKKATDMEEKFAEDIEFSRRIREAWKSHDKGEFKSLPADKFLEILEKC
jgi:AbrB family looped-hinge helix DNA binding protein